MNKTKIVLTLLLVIGMAHGARVVAQQARAGQPQRAEQEQVRTDAHGDPLPPGALLRLGTIRHRYPDWGSRCQALPDGKTLLCSTAHEVRWIDRASRRVRRSWQLPEGSTVCSFSPDGRWVLLREKTILELWDLASGKKLRSFQPKGELGHLIYEVLFSTDDKLMVTNSGDRGNPGLIRVWDLATGKELWQEGIMGFWDRGLDPLGFLPDQKTLVVLDKASTRISLREGATGRPLRSFATMPKKDLRQCRLSPDGKTIFMGTAGPTVRAWDVASGKELPALGGHPEQAHSFAISQDCKVVLTGGGMSFIQVWDWPSGKLRRKIELGTQAGILSLAVSDDGKRAEIIIFGENALRFFDLSTGKELPGPAAAHRGPVYGLAITPDGQVVSAGTDNTMRLWDCQDGRQLRVIRTEHPIGASTLSMSADGRLTATADFNRGKVLLYEGQTGRRVRTLECGETARFVAFAPQGHQLAISAADVSLSGVDSRFIALWDTDTGRELRRFKKVSGKPVFSPDGKLLAAQSGGQAQLWEIATGRIYRTLPLHVGSRIAFAPDGRMLACGDAGGITLWEVVSARRRCRIEASFAHPAAICFSGDGRWLAQNDGSAIRLFDVRAGRLLHTFRGHQSSIEALAFSPRGERLVSASYDSTLLVWDVASVTAQCQQPGGALPATALAAAWKDLAGADAEAAYRSIGRLVQSPQQTVPLLAERLQPARVLDGKDIDRLLDLLDSDDFSQRQQAERQLEQQGDVAVPALRRFLAGQPSLEAQRRGKALLARLEGPEIHPEHLRSLRAVEVLETIGSRDARRVLQKLAGGAAQAGLTREAKVALERLNISLLPGAK